MIDKLILILLIQWPYKTTKAIYMNMMKIEYNNRNNNIQLKILLIFKILQYLIHKINRYNNKNIVHRNIVYNINRRSCKTTYNKIIIIV